MFNITSPSAITKISQRQTGTPAAFDKDKRDPYQLYSLPNDGKGRKMTTPFSLGFPNEPTDGSSSSLGGSKFDRVNPDIAHPYSESGDSLGGNADPENPFYFENDPRSEYEDGNSVGFYSDSHPLSRNSDVFGDSGRDSDPSSLQGDLGHKSRTFGRNAS